MAGLGAVDRRRASEDEPFHRVHAAEFQKLQRCLDVHLLVEQWGANGGANPGACGQVDYLGDRMLCEDISHGRRIGDGNPMQVEPWRGLRLTDILPLERWVIEVIEVIDADNRLPLCE